MTASDGAWSDGETSLRARRLRGLLLLLWLPALAACFLPVALGLSPVQVVGGLGLGIGSSTNAHSLVLDSSTRLLLLALSLGACSPLAVLPWRVLGAWRSPSPSLVPRVGRALLMVLAITNALALALLLLGVLQGDRSMIAPLVAELVGLGTLTTLALPAWRALPLSARLTSALLSAYVGSALATVSIFARRPETGWWFLACGAVVAAADIALLPRSRG